MKLLKNKTGLILLVLVAIIGLVLFKYIYKAPLTINQRDIAFTGTATEMALKIQKSPNEWQNKIVELTGRLTSKNEKTLMLDNKVFCQFEKTIDLQKINTKVISIKGRVIGYDDLLDEVKLDQVILKH